MDVEAALNYFDDLEDREPDPEEFDFSDEVCCPPMKRSA